MTLDISDVRCYDNLWFLTFQLQSSHYYFAAFHKQFIILLLKFGSLTVFQYPTYYHHHQNVLHSLSTFQFFSILVNHTEKNKSYQNTVTYGCWSVRRCLLNGVMHDFIPQQTVSLPSPSVGRLTHGRATRLFILQLLPPRSEQNSPELSRTNEVIHECLIVTQGCHTSGFSRTCPLFQG